MGRIRIGRYQCGGDSLEIVSYNNETVKWRWVFPHRNGEIRESYYNGDDWNHDFLINEGWKFTPKKCIVL